MSNKKKPIPIGCTVIQVTRNRITVGQEPKQRPTKLKPKPEPEIDDKRSKFIKLDPDAHSKRLVLFEKDPTCYYCGRQFDRVASFSIDHVVPKSKGGSNRVKNRVLCCKACNNDKADHAPVDYAYILLRRLKAVVGHGSLKYGMFQRMSLFVVSLCLRAFKEEK